MAAVVEVRPATPPGAAPRRLFAAPLAILSAIAFLAPTFAGEGGASLIALLLNAAGFVEIWHGFRRATIKGQRAAWVGGAITIAMGVLITNAAALAATGVVVLLAGWFALDAIRYAASGLRGDDAGARGWVLPALGNAAAVVLLMALRRYTLDWTLALAGGLRIAGTAWNIVTSPVFASHDAGTTTLAPGCARALRPHRS